ncbi:uncharacterized protein LOC127852831 isoform X1 [Dreissena polymorpha]|uniref:Uncharacterized protein n=1 Tax=Dreissena polymorpha TaxID=45954 RepID=A0A9D4HNZ2_DREPO|nr:uncharacterized protein LOC127852831 isoform X1 [Dreissena polymorpha]KAH3726219.1 hypothetical protein DPMN_052077 [Dreissena polymorpha]
MSSSPRSGKSVELDMSDKLIATPILHNSVVDRAHVRSLHFGALADDPNIAQFRKIKPKLAEDSIAPRVIIVHASQFVPTTTPVLTHAVPQLIPVPTKPDETILTGSNKSSESQKSNSESKSPLKTPNKNSHRTGVFKGEVSRSNGDTLMNISSVIQSKSPQTMCEIKDCQKEQNSSVESCAIGIYESKGVNKVAAKEKQHKKTSFENNSKELRNTKIEDKKNQIIGHDQVQMEDQNKSEHDSQKQCISQGLNQPNEVTRKESNDEKQKETNKSGIRKNRKSVNKLKVKIPSVSRTNVNLKSPEIKKSLVVFTKKKHAPVGDVESNCATADDLPLAVLRKQIKQSTNGVKKSGDMVEGSHATKECDSSRNKMGSFLSKQQTSYKTHTDKDFGSNQNTKIKRETCSTNGDHDRNRKSNDNNYTIRNINSNNKLTAAIVKVEDITDKVCCLSKHRQYSEPSTPKKQVSESEEVTPSKEQMLEKVGLTPTKSVSATISPKRASVLEFLSDWRRSPSAKTKTPNTRSKQRKLEEIMKYPLTPRRRSLFKSPTSSTNEIITENIDDKQKSEKTVKRVNNILGKLHKNNPEDNLISCVKDRTEIVKETLLADSDQALDGPCQRLFAIDTNTAKINKNLKYNRVTISDDIKSPEKECEDESLVKTISESVCSENNLGDIDELETSVNNLVDIMEKDVPTKAAASSIIDTDFRENSFTDMNYKFTIVKETSSQVPLVEGGKHISSELHTVEISLKNTSIYQKTLIMENAAANLNKENIGGNQDNCDHKSCDLCEPTTSELLEEISVNSNNSLNTKILREVPERHHKKKSKHKHRHKHSHDKSNDENSEFTNHRKHVLSVSEEGEPKHKPRPRQSRSDPHGTELDMASSEGARQSALVDEQGHTHGQNSHKEDTGLTSADAARDRLRNDHQHGDAGPGSHRAKRKRSHSPPGSHTTKRLREEKSLAELNIDEALSKLYST